MPPKRKHTDDNSKETTRSTRSSTRNKATVAKTGAAESAPSKTTSKRSARGSLAGNREEDHEDSVEKQPAKRARTTKAVGRGKKQTKSSATINDDESSATGQTLVHDEDHKVKPTKAAVAPSQKDEPYTSQRALALFEAYADPDEPGVIGPEGFEKLCADAGHSMESSVPLILAWQMEAKEMAKISKEEWLSGTQALRIPSPQQLSIALTDLENLLIYGKPPIKKTKTDPYDRTRYYGYASDPKDAFHKLYIYCFMLVKPPSSKNIEMETAAAFWSVLLGPKYPLMKEVLDYINEKGTYRAANKDLWNMMLEFCETVNPNLDNFEADGAWPTLLDEFATWKKAKSEGT